MPCDICQREVSADELIELQGKRVCDACKPMAVQRLQSVTNSRRWVVVCLVLTGLVVLLSALIATTLGFGSRREVAAAQTGMMYLRIVLFPVQAVCAYRLAARIPLRLPLLWAGILLVGVCSGLFDFVVLLVLNHKARVFLRKYEASVDPPVLQ